MSYWPWWMGAASLGAIAAGFAAASGRTLGVSGSVARVASAREVLAAERVEAAMADDSAPVHAARLAATGAHFGAAALSECDLPAAAPPGRAPRVASGSTPLVAHVAFLAMLVLGAFAAAMIRGGWRVTVTEGPAYARFFGTGAGMLAALFGGGVLVGLGTQMSGGCTSGHGLSGTSRFVPSSLVATAAFFGVAVATSFALAAWAGA